MKLITDKTLIKKESLFHPASTVQIQLFRSLGFMSILIILILDQGSRRESLISFIFYLKLINMKDDKRCFTRCLKQK